MRIIYGYSNCTDALYRKICSERNVSTMAPDQKYHSLMIKGLAANVDEVRCFSGLPINRAVTARKLVSEPDEQVGNVHYHYITTLNFPVIRQLMVFFGTLFGMLRLKKQKDTYAVCDFLNVAVAMAIVVGCKLRRIKKIAIVTDIPDMFDSGSMSKKVRNFVLRRFDAYVFLTEYMKEFTPEGKPYIVMEGHVDSEAAFAPMQETYEETVGKKVVIYAGNIHAKYGIEYFVNGFVKADIPDAELRVYGHGDFCEKLQSIAAVHPQVRYMGVKDNAEVVAEEQRASLLVNPRPTAPIYTKYSFPSKNMEYMVSGTPMMTTALPGMPEEYYPYVWLIEDETEDGAAQALKAFFALPFAERRKKAQAARAYVLENKTNVAQAKRIVDFLTEQF